MKTKMITLTNDFHGTSVNVRVPADDWSLREAQITRTRRALCGVDDCSCAMDDAGCRPRQVEVKWDGSGFVIPTGKER
jgi:hypothetical protein